MSIYTTTIKMVYIYLLGLREFRITKNPIVKVGKCASYHSRFVNYPNLSEIYSIYDIEDVDINVENQIIKIFEIIFTKEEKYGKEYFMGDFKKMASIIEIYLESKNIPFSKVDLFNDFFEYNIHKQMIHSSNIWNTNIYNYIIEYMNSKNMDLSILNDPFSYENFYYDHFCKKRNETKPKKKSIKNEVIQNEVVENKVIQNKKYGHKTYYICHHCLKYETINLKDIKKHVNRKKKCTKYTGIVNTILDKNSFYQLSILSTSKKFVFYFDNSNLNINEWFYIITKYTNTINHINIDFKNDEILYKNELEDNKLEDNKLEDNKLEDNEVEDNELEDHELEDNELEDNEVEDHEVEDHEVEDHEVEDHEVEDNELEDLNDHFNKTFYNKKLNLYICNCCFSKYKSKQNMINHIHNEKQCKKRKELYDLINKNKK